MALEDKHIHDMDVVLYFGGLRRPSPAPIARMIYECVNWVQSPGTGWIHPKVIDKDAGGRDATD